jgi:hypothetical protein
VLNDDSKKLLAKLRPDPQVLIDILRPRVDDSMLAEMARLDYGCQEEEHLSALCGIRDTGRIPVRLQWAPLEVLNLTRWGLWAKTEPHYLMQAFACAVLLRAASDAESAPYINGEEPTIGQFLDSALVLGTDVQRAALRFFAWRLDTWVEPEYSSEQKFFWMAVLFLAALVLREPSDADLLADLARWTEDMEQRADFTPGIRYEDDGWFLRTTTPVYNADRWVDVGRQVLLDPALPHLPGAERALRRIGELLVYGKSELDPPDAGSGP